MSEARWCGIYCMGKGYRIFIAGVIQGSKRNLDIHDQAYRYSIKNILMEAFPNSTLFCPVENHPNSTSYGDKKSKAVFFKHIEILRQSHGMVVYLPEASLGCGIEMWESYQHKIITVTISPMITNWVVRLFSDKICETMDGFRDFVESGEMGKLLHSRFPTVVKE